MDQTIWRYMDFTKFVAMLENRGLYFCSLPSLDDPFEGSLTVGTRDRLRADAGSRERSRQLIQAVRRATYVSCWHANEHESEAMWKLYSHSNEGIAIRSDLARLRRGLPGEDIGIEIEPVIYIDYRDPRRRMDLERTHFYKRKAFEHERELRASFRDPELFARVARGDEEVEIPGGRWVPVELESVVLGVYVSPASEEWIADLLSSLIRRYGFRMEVHRSRLLEEPALG
jgi:hypothetical protein